MEERKPIWKGRTNTTIYDNNEIDVRLPQDSPDLKQTKLCESKNGSISKSPNKVILKASVKADEADMRSALIEEVNNLFGKLPDKMPDNVKLKNQGRWLSNEEDIKIRADTKEKKVNVLISLPLGTSQQVLEVFYQRVADISKCISKNQTTLSKMSRPI